MAQYNSNYTGKLIDNVIGNALTAASFINTNKGTSVGKIMVADNSNGLGYSTPSDLASVLGVNGWTNYVHTATTGMGKKLYIDEVGYLHSGLVLVAEDAGYQNNFSCYLFAYNASSVFSSRTLFQVENGTPVSISSSSNGRIYLLSAGNAYLRCLLFRTIPSFTPYEA